jgi:hypothetical protein
VQGDASVLGAAPREPGALPAQDVHELLLGQALRLIHQRVQAMACHTQLQIIHTSVCLKQAYIWLVPHLLHVVLIVTEIEIYVGVDAAELDRRSIVRSASHGKQFQD